MEPAEVVISVMPVNEDVPPEVHTGHNRNDVHYLNSANQVLATSDIMVIAKQGL